MPQLPKRDAFGISDEARTGFALDQQQITRAPLTWQQMATIHMHIKKLETTSRDLTKALRSNQQILVYPGSFEIFHECQKKDEHRIDWIRRFRLFSTVNKQPREFQFGTITESWTWKTGQNQEVNLMRPKSFGLGRWTLGLSLISPNSWNWRPLSSFSGKRCS